MSLNVEKVRWHEWVYLVMPMVLRRMLDDCFAQA